MASFPFLSPPQPRPWLPFVLGVSFLGTIVLGCSPVTTGDRDPSGAGEGTEATGTEATGAEATGTEETGALEIRANGEDLVRQGWVSKDGWGLQLDQVWVTLGQIQAHQTDPPFGAEPGETLQPQVTVDLPGVHRVDLAAGDETATPIAVGTIDPVPVGQFNALSWGLVNPPPPLNPSEMPGEGSLVLVGKASKGEQTIAFKLVWREEMQFVCGEYVGDDRKGFVTPGGTGDLEITLHWDHLFGQGDLPPEDDLNQGALGFEPLAAIAQGNTLEITSSQLQQQLSPENQAKFQALLPNLGHVGEGHCTNPSPSATPPSSPPPQ